MGKKKKEEPAPRRQRRGADQMIAMIADLEAKIERKARKQGHASTAQKPATTRSPRRRTRPPRRH